MSDTFSPDDVKFMQLALELAAKGQYTTAPNPSVGCVLVKNGEIVGKGFHFKAGEPHAERVALADAGEKAKGATAYVTLEPCPMCAGAIINSRIEKVYFGAYDKKSGCAGSVINLFESGMFNHNVNVTGGITEDKCASILTEFFRDLRKKK